MTNMSDMEQIENNLSLEAELDRKIELLIDKMVSGEATPQERSEYQALVERRSRMMRSPVLDRLRELKKLRYA